MNNAYVVGDTFVGADGWIGTVSDVLSDGSLLVTSPPVADENGEISCYGNIYRPDGREWTIDDNPRLKALLESGVQVDLEIVPDQRPSDEPWVRVKRR